MYKSRVFHIISLLLLLLKEWVKQVHRYIEFSKAPNIGIPKHIPLLSLMVIILLLCMVACLDKCGLVVRKESQIVLTRGELLGLQQTKTI